MSKFDQERMCLCGPRQFGTEDQGWVAHFLIQAIQGQALVKT